MSSNTDRNIYIHNLNTGNEQEDVFAITGTGSTSLITPTSTSTNTTYDVSQTSFVIGSDRLNHDPDADGNKDKRMLFDKTKGAFRTGIATGTQWDSSNRGNYSAAFGSNNITSGISSFAVGTNNTVSGENNIALGNLNTISINTGGTAAIAIGSRNNIVNTSEYAITIGQDNTTSTGNNCILMGNNNTSGSFHDSIAIGHTNTSTGTDSVAIGENCTAETAYSFAIGQYCSTSIGSNSMAIGKYAKATGFDSISIGIGTDDASNAYRNFTGGAKSVAIGFLSKTNGEQSVAIGQYCTTDGLNSFAIGYSDSTGDAVLLNTSDRNYASGTGAFAIGCKNQSTGTNSFAIGKYNTASATNSFALGTGVKIKSNAEGSFVWRSSLSMDTSDDHVKVGSVHFICGPNNGNEFRISFGMVSTGINVNSETGYAWANVSDINLKENLVEHIYSDTLARIMEMPIYTYNFKTTASGIKSIGPVAQDFNRLFPSDKDPLSIVDRDMCGVALAGVRGVKLGLDSLSESTDSRITALETRIATLEAAMNP